MQKISTTLALIIGLISCSISTAQVTFQKSIGGANFKEDNAEAIIETADLGYLVVGNTQAFGAGDHDIFLVKLTQNGDTVWTKAYGTNGIDKGKGVCEVADGSIYVIGETSNNQGNGLNDIILIKCDANGSLQWNKLYGSAEDDFGLGVAPGTNNGCVITGQTFGTNDQGDVLLSGIASDGTLSWSYSLGEGSYDDKLYGISQCADGGYILAGEAGSSWQGSFVVRLDAAGDTVWTGSYGGDGYYYAHDIKETSDNGFIMTGYTTSGAGGGIDMFLMKLDVAGAIEWAETYGSSGYEDGQAVIETATGYSLFGITTLFGAGSYDYYMINTSPTGAFLSAKTYGASSTDEGKDMIATADGGIVMVGQFYNMIDFYQAFDMYVVKTDANGIVNGCYLDANATMSGTDLEVQGNIALTIGLGLTGTSITVTESNTTANNQELAIQVYFETTAPTCGTLCNGELVADGCDQWGICGGVTPYSYEWSNGVTTADNPDICAGTYGVTLTDQNGCKGSGDTSLAIVADPIEMCLSSVDSTSTMNVIMWEKPAIYGIDSFRVYREITNNYTYIGAVDYDDVSQFIDLTNGVNPNITYYRYKISVLDSCGNESELSDFHETMHVYTTIGAGGEITVNWNDYVGFGSSIFYRIMRDSTGTGDHFRKIDSTSYGITSYTDLNPIIGTSAYMIEVIAPQQCTSTKAVSRRSSKSNRPTINPGGGGNYIFDLMLKENVHIYPNPNNGQFNLVGKFLSSSQIGLKVTTINGKTILDEQLLNTSGTINKQIDLSKYEKGFYFISLSDGNRSTVKKLVIK